MRQAGMELPPKIISESNPIEKGPGALYAAFALFAAGLLVYSQTLAFHWDEGFHILTAHLISAGKRPYLDFFFPQTPLNAYWNAAWMAVFGHSWRAVHAIAALATVGSVALIAQYLFALFPDRRWRPGVAFAALALFGLNSLVWEFGAISQAYALCLLLIVAAFRSAAAAVSRPRFLMCALAGILAGAAAASSLLIAAAPVVLLVWIWANNRAGSRWQKIAGFVVGAAIPWAPILWLFARGPHQVIFNIIKFHLFYRSVNWSGATGNDIGVATGWINNSPSLLLVLLAFAGLFAIRKMGFDSARRSEFRLCLWLTAAMGAQNLTAHPTFSQYFIFLLPFLTVVAAIGFYTVALRLVDSGRPRVCVIVMLCVAVLCLGSSLYDQDEDYCTWRQLERVTDKVKQVTPKDAPLYAPEQIYFLARWPVPYGLEHDDSSKFQLSEAESARLHVLPKGEGDRRIKAGSYATAVVCDDDKRADELQGWDIYSQNADFGECTVFWQLTPKTAQPSSPLGPDSAED